MSENSYDYSHREGIYPISWNDFHGLCKALVAAISAFNPEIILAVGRGGYYPGTLIAHLLRVEIYPVRLTRRVNDVVVRERPQWLVEPSAAVAGKRVLIVDEIVSSGETVLLVKEKAEALGAGEVRTAVLYAHTWGVNIPDYIGLISDALLLNPWDREIWYDGDFHFHPEYVEAMAQQGMTADPLLLIPATSFSLAKTIQK